MFVAAPIRPNSPVGCPPTGSGNIMMKKSLAVCALLLALATPVLANNGNGNGHASGNGNTGQANASANSSNGNNGQANAAANNSNGNGSNASALGALNGFMHASFTALSHTSLNSEI